MTRPSVCPRCVSMTAWQSTPAVKPGPTPITTGASLSKVPRFFLASMASTTASGLSSRMQPASGSINTAMRPLCRTAMAPLELCVSSAITPSTIACPSVTACEKLTVLLMAVGRAISVITTSNLARQSLSAMPEAISPAPFMTTSMVLLLNATRPPPPDRPNVCLAPWPAPTGGTFQPC